MEGGSAARITSLQPHPRSSAASLARKHAFGGPRGSSGAWELRVSKPPAPSFSPPRSAWIFRPRWCSCQRARSMRLPAISAPPPLRSPTPTPSTTRATTWWRWSSRWCSQRCGRGTDRRRCRRPARRVWLARARALGELELEGRGCLSAGPCRPQRQGSPRAQLCQPPRSRGGAPRRACNPPSLAHQAVYPPLPLTAQPCLLPP